MRPAVYAESRSQPVIPPQTLAQLSVTQGAMWTVRAPVPWGPRPNQPDNCICIDYFECFSPSDQKLIIGLYGPHSLRRYRDAPMGPIVDPGYHGQLPATDWRGNIDVYLDAAITLERAGIRVSHFLRPDRGVAGLDWTVEDLDRELTPLFSTPKAQAVMRKVCLGWEPGPRYFYNNAWWVAMVQWMARVFPDAHRSIHMVNDCDAPVGGDDDRKGISNGQAWCNVAPYLHNFHAQYAGYYDNGHGGFWDRHSPSWPAHYAEYRANQAAAIADMVRRFTTGYAGWPTSSAFGDGVPMTITAAEYAAFADYWANYPESESQAIGDLCVAAGAAGYLDGGLKQLL